MKRILSLLMAIVMFSMCLGLVACGGNQQILIDGENLAEYTVVIPKDCDKVTQYAAENFIFLVKDYLGITLNLVTDDTAPVEKEILIGETNRDESKTTTELKDGEYLLFIKNKKIVMKGYGIYVGGACGDFVNKHIKPIYKENKNKIKVKTLANEPVACKFAFAEKATSVIFMIGDGMGENHIKMAERLIRVMPEPFIGRSFPHQGQAITASLSVLNGDAAYTDSAASATALSTGYKTLNRRVGMDANEQSLLNVRELARSKGAKTAVITTDLLTGATPGGFLCHYPDRDAPVELQAQIDALVEKGEVDYVKGDIPHLRLSPTNSITVELKTALETISKDGSSFFVMAEEGYIDKYSHDGEELNVMYSVVRFNDAITYAVEFALCHPETALIVTADHETGGLTEDAEEAAGFKFTSRDHTNADVPVYAIGAGTQIFNGKKVDNTEIAKFVASAYSSESFGNQTGY